MKLIYLYMCVYYIHVCIYIIYMCIYTYTYIYELISVSSWSSHSSHSVHMGLHLSWEMAVEKEKVCIPSTKVPLDSAYHLPLESPSFPLTFGPQSSVLGRVLQHSQPKALLGPTYYHHCCVLTSSQESLAPSGPP